MKKSTVIWIKIVNYGNLYISILVAQHVIEANYYRNLTKLTSKLYINYMFYKLFIVIKRIGIIITNFVKYFYGKVPTTKITQITITTIICNCVLKNKII